MNFIRQVLITGAIVCVTALVAAPLLAQCSPFGNGPQQLLGDPKPQCSGGKALGGFKDSNGTPRYACLYEPANASASKPLPLVVYLHPSTVTADSVTATKLLGSLKSANVSGDSSKLGFILLAPEGRKTTHLYGPPGTPDSADLGWDVWYRQSSPAGDVTVNDTLYVENVDAAAIDHFIGEEVATGKVDTNRIFLTGWSNGATMAFLYALSRPNIAAVAPYSGPDPFGFLFTDTCYQTPVVEVPKDDTQLQVYNPTVPILHVHNNCDISGSCPNAEKFVMEMLPLGIFVHDAIINGPQAPANGCDFSCGVSIDGSFAEINPGDPGVKNHIRWPTNWNSAILDFFRRHPLNGRPK